MKTRKTTQARGAKRKPTKKVTPYARFRQKHPAWVAQLPAELRAVVRRYANYTPAKRRLFVRFANKIAPGFGTLLAKVVRP